MEMWGNKKKKIEYLQPVWFSFCPGFDWFPSKWEHRQVSEIQGFFWLKKGNESFETAWTSSKNLKQLCVTCQVIKCITNEQTEWCCRDQGWPEGQSKKVGLSIFRVSLLWTDGPLFAAASVCVCLSLCLTVPHPACVTLLCVYTTLRCCPVLLGIIGVLQQRKTLQNKSRGFLHMDCLSKKKKRRIFYYYSYLKVQSHAVCHNEWSSQWDVFEGTANGNQQRKFWRRLHPSKWNALPGGPRLFPQENVRPHSERLPAARLHSGASDRPACQRARPTSCWKTDREDIWMNKACQILCVCVGGDYIHF